MHPSPRGPVGGPMPPRAAALLLAAALGGLAGGAVAARVRASAEGDGRRAHGEPQPLGAGPAGLARAIATLQGPGAESLLKEGGALLDRKRPVINEPSKYQGYIEEISRAIVVHDEGALAVADYDGSDNKVRDGTILFNVVGTCPSNLMCTDQAVTVADFGGSVVAYWSKPHPEIKGCTRERHVKKGDCKNDSDKFHALEQLFRDGGDYYIDSSTKRAVVKKGGENLYIYLVYASHWSSWYNTMDGWLLYQKDPKVQEFFRIQFQSGKDAKFHFVGEGEGLGNFWPAKWEVDLP